MLDEQLNDQVKDETTEAIKIVDTSERAEVSFEEDGKNPKDSLKSILKEIYDYIVLILIAFVAAQLIHTHLFTPVSVDGISMKPTLQDNDYLLLWRRGTLERFDVVVFEVPSEDNYIKRLIGLPGDYVMYDDTKLYINGELIDEPYADKTKSGYAFALKYNFTLEQVCAVNNVDCNVNGKIQIPEGYYLVMGDNRSNSTDSRSLGLIKEEVFLGEASHVLYPFSRIRNLKQR